MPRKTKPALPATVRRLQERIEEWRRTRPRRTHMPPELWTEAVALAQSEGAYPVARAVRVNFETLKRRVSEAAGCAVPASSPPSAFVEVSGAQLLAAPPVAGAVVELEDGGRRLVLRLPPEAALDVAQVLAAFLGRGA